MPADADLRHLGRAAPEVCGLDAVAPSWEIFRRPGFLRTLEAFRADDPPVSSSSRFRGSEWVLDVAPPSSYPTVRVDFHDIDEGLAEELKVAILVAILHPSSRRLSIETATNFGMVLAMLGRWMTHARLTTLSDLGAGFGDLFMEALAEFVAELHGGTLDPDAGDWDPRPRIGKDTRLALLGAGGRLGAAGAEIVAGSLIFLDEAAPLIERLCGAAVRGAPFRTDVARQVASSFPESADRTTRRIPDAVLSRLVPAARLMLGVPAADVRRLLVDFVALCEGGLAPPRAAGRLAGFEFGEVVEGAGPWCEGLARRASHPALSIRSLLQQILSAALLIVMLGTGMRPGEVLGLMGGRRPRGEGEGWLPRCVTESPSKSGFSVAMLLHGHVFKQRRRPLPVSWLLALRQPDEADPWVLRALRTIEELSEVLRPLAPEGAREMLVLDFAGRSYDKLAVDRVHSAKLAMMVRSSIPRFLDLSEIDPDAEEAGRPLRPYVESDGGCIAIYQCRKTFAQTLYAISPNLLLPISRQYQHASPDATFAGYVTNDAVFARELESYRSRRIARQLHEELEGEESDAPSMAPVLDRVLASAAERPSEEAREAFWARSRDVSGGLFRPGRLRPEAGAANLIGPAAAAGSPGGGREAELGRSGPAELREWMAARRRVDAAVAAGAPDDARPARDVAIAIARELRAKGHDVTAREEPTGGGDG
ncbi:hypothetical protein [Sphingomonas sp. TX0522]|uniref:hypothetical protein n=1 Tax=Sphingomonas sp. TX0522 TaxID=2479205 RepID=UPI0018E03003|nr:hypothetical protein [Sphingomonas sp. TX0522]MBI0532025.1 hypothetical protein [Sphingomonas sp. TX0522]